METGITVIIPVLNDGAHLETTVRNVIANSKGLVREVLIAVGPSTDDSLHVAKRLAADDDRVRVLPSPTGRTPDSLNLAIEAASSPFIARVDARSRIPHDYFAHALETLTTTGAANVGAVQVPVGTSTTQRAIAAAMSSLVGSGGVAYRHADAPQRVDTAWLGFFRRDALLQVGGYDTRFSRNQDAELNTRLRSAGHEVWVDSRLRVEYLPRSSVRSLASQFYEYGYWRFRTAITHRSLAVRQAAVPAAMLAVTAGLVLAPWQVGLLAIPGLYFGALVVSVGVDRHALGLRGRCIMLIAHVTMHACWTAGFLRAALSIRRWRHDPKSPMEHQ